MSDKRDKTYVGEPEAMEGEAELAGMAASRSGAPFRAPTGGDMSLPKFVQIAVQASNERIVALGDDGTVWIWGYWRPLTGPGSDAPYKHCWYQPKGTYDEAWPKPVPPPPPQVPLEACLIPPPTLEEEAMHDVERLLAVEGA